jgi:hypothetical protein
MSHLVRCHREPRASPKGIREDYHGSVNGQYKDHGPLRARRDGSYGPYPPLERVPCAGLRAAARPLAGYGDDLPVVV